MTAPFHVSYRLNRWDLAGWGVVHVLHNHVLLAMSLLSAAGIGWMCRGNPVSPVAMTSTALSTFGLTWIGYLLVIPLLIVFQTSATRRTEVQIELDPSGIRSKSVYGHSEIRWALVSGIRRCPRATCLVFSSNQALIIPDRAFADTASVEAFGRFCREQVVNASRSGTHTSSPS